MGEFRHFLILEQEEYFAQKVGDVLTALQSLADDAPNMGNRQLIKLSEKIVDQMRKILEGRWAKEEEPYLKLVQKAAVALAKAIDTNEKMAEVIASAKQELEALQQKIGAPINNIGSVETPKGSQADEPVQQPG
jgi:hypothetical protein